MKPSRAFLTRAALRSLTRIPRYFTYGDGPADSLANVAIALRRFPETMLYDVTFGHPPNYLNPRKYTEQMQWRKLFDRNPEWGVWCDKLAARDLAKQRAPDVSLPDLLWTGTDPNELPLDTLEPPYVIKANNRSSAVILVESAADVDQPRIRETCRRWMEASAHRRRVYEWAYSQVPTRILVEEFLSRSDILSSPQDMKMFVFEGRVERIYMRDLLNHRSAIYSRDWQRFEWDRWEPLVADGPVPYLDDFPRPTRLTNAISIAERIAAGLDHLRVDLYDLGGRIYFGESTVYPSSGNKQWIHHNSICDPYPPDDVDREFHALWDPPIIPKRTMLRRGLGRSR